MKKRSDFKFLIGIDEVGRGPIAGPVAVGAFLFPSIESRKLFKGVKESKQLNEKKREVWYEEILQARKNGLVDFAVTFQSEKVIDTKGLSFAIKNALKISLNKIVKKNKIKANEVLVLLDGGLKAPIEFVNQKTIIKGDAKEKVIALASICAKVERDRYMHKMAKKHPQYGFDIHKGYGTRKHYGAIKKYGLSQLHRKSFCKIMPK
jgi:ribonuclease HII